MATSFLQAFERSLRIWRRLPISLLPLLRPDGEEGNDDMSLVVERLFKSCLRRDAMFGPFGWDGEGTLVVSIKKANTFLL